MVKGFIINDYTLKVIVSPVKYSTDYMMSPNSIKQKMAKLISKYAIWFVPGYIWVLEKPAEMKT